MGKTVLYLGISLDGYLADRQGGVGWLEGQRPSGSDYGYQAFYSRVGLVVMGYNTYRQVKEELSPGAWPYDGVPCLVCTHRPLQDPGVETVSGPPEHWLPAWKERVQGDVWICGGASLAGQLMEQGLIDEYALTVCPAQRGGRHPPLWAGPAHCTAGPGGMPHRKRDGPAALCAAADRWDGTGTPRRSIESGHGATSRDYCAVF